MKPSLKQIIALVFISIFPILTTAKITVTIQDGFGMNMHLQQRVHQTDWEQATQLAETAGVQWGREELNWNVIEPTDNQYSWTKYDAVVQAYQAHHIQIVGLLTYSSTWAADSEITPPDLTAWQDYVGTVAEHYKDSISYWEIWNEPNHAGFWNSDVDTYAQYLAAAATAIKTKNPNTKIVLGGLSGADSDFLSQVYDNLTNPNVIDVVAIHPYRMVGENLNYAPEDTADGLNTLISDLYNIKAISQRYQGKRVPIWLTEVGWTTATTGVTETEQAQYLQRLYTIALSVPDVEKVFWYALNDTSNDVTKYDTQFGIFSTTFIAKPAATALQNIQANVDGKMVRRWGIAKPIAVSEFTNQADWQFAGAQCTEGRVADHVNNRLSIYYRFDAGNCYAPIVSNQDLPLNTTAVQFRAKGNNDATILRLRVVDATGETVQYTLSNLPAQWLPYIVQLNQHATHWGGNNDGIIQQPITALAFVLDHPTGEATSLQQIQFDDLAVSTRAQQYRYFFQKNSQLSQARWNSTKANYSWR